MKETIKVGILLLLVVLVAIFVTTTKGDDELNWNIEWPEVKEEFSYKVYPSDFNGQYKNNKGNSIYAFVGKNADDTYRIYFIEDTLGRNVILKLDSNTMKNDEITFTDTTSNVKLKIRFSQDTFTVSPASIGFSNEKLEGSYMKTKDIDVFSMSEFEYDIKQRK